MKVLVTGKSGFLAKEFSANLKGFDLVFAGRQELNLTDKKSVEEFFTGKTFDAVLHTAIKGGRRASKDTFEDFSDNILMFNNLLAHKDKYGKLINFCSGAAFARSEVYQCAENVLYTGVPSRPYGMSKNIIARECNKIDDFYNLRIFGCFGLHEEDTRFIKSSMIKALQGESIVVHQNKMMDFISSEDLCTVVAHFLNEDCGKDFKDVNLCYDKKTTLRNIAYDIVSLTKSDSEVIIQEPNFGYAYTGNSNKLSELNLELKGLDGGLLSLLEKLIG